MNEITQDAFDIKRRFVKSHCKGRMCCECGWYKHDKKRCGHKDYPGTLQEIMRRGINE